MIAPPQAHDNCDVESRAGTRPKLTVAHPGTQGVNVIGMHGMGVKTPNAAAVAEATAGFTGDVHIPKEVMLVTARKSMMVAAGWLLVLTRLAANTIKEAGARPKVHPKEAPLQTC